jgi:hypothetical protein
VAAGEREGGEGNGGARPGVGLKAVEGEKGGGGESRWQSMEAGQVGRCDGAQIRV